MTEVLVALAFVPAVGFPLVYGLFFPWWRSPAGWSVWLLSAVIGLSLSLSAWRYFIGPPPPIFRNLIYGLIVVALWTQFVTLLLAPWLNRRRIARDAKVPIPPEVLP